MLFLALYTSNVTEGLTYTLSTTAPQPTFTPKEEKESLPGSLIDIDTLIQRYSQEVQGPSHRGKYGEEPCPRTQRHFARPAIEPATV